MTDTPFSSVGAKKTDTPRTSLLTLKTDTPFSSVTWLKTDTPQKIKTVQVQECIKSLTKGDERNIGVKVIPMDYQRKRVER